VTEKREGDKDATFPPGKGLGTDKRVKIDRKAQQEGGANMERAPALRKRGRAGKCAGRFGGEKSMPNQNTGRGGVSNSMHDREKSRSMSENVALKSCKRKRERGEVPIKSLQNREKSLGSLGGSESKSKESGLRSGGRREAKRH